MIFVECYADHLLFAQLKHEHEEVHAGINEVGNRMKAERMKGKKCLGIIDNDKKQSDYFKQDFVPIDESENLIFLRHRTEKHYLIKIKPAAEGFILSCAQQAEIDPTRYKLPTAIKELKSRTKKKEILKDQQFINFINQIVAREKNGIKQLRQYIEQFQKAK